MSGNEEKLPCLNELTKRKFLVSDTKYGTLSIHADYQANTCVHIYHRVVFGYFCKSPDNIPQACKKEKKISSGS